MHRVMLFVLGRIVLYILAAAVPSQQTILRFLLRVEKWTHTVVIQTIRFVEVYYVEFVHLSFARVRNSKVEPLSKLAR